MQKLKKFGISKSEIIEVATRMKAEGRALVMIHGFVDSSGQNVISYDYEVGSVIESYDVVGESSLPSISEIYDQAAAWPEHELTELLEISFEGLDTSTRLFLPESMLDGQGQIMVTPLSELTEKAQVKKED